ncbi:glutathione S-transferase [Cognatishimia sp. SS12]|uniref:glutathione S-transferase n=1 Tax=Cognatishimia sp. SS12 TaxID=2979465 RepID=UPI00232C1AE9|nr:glutathione S-transferase [Cognatishimia sp. SS12]MDC0739012.1 glutathione S-transferase [Cognatishimia sp. SS12]
MTYDLAIGDYAYSSWSLRGWLLFEKYAIPRHLHLVSFAKDASVADQLPDFAPARTVPAVRTPDGAVVSESLAIIEELSARHPELAIWPSAPKNRAIARNLAAEMHSGFMALRSACPMNLREAFIWPEPSADVLQDVARIEKIWAHARAEADAGPWLLGAYSGADIMFAPVAARLAGYDLPMSALARDYVTTHLSDPAFRRWRAMGLVHGPRLHRYDQPHPLTDWPGPTPLVAKASDATPENAACPYSGKPSTHMLELNGRTFGFCNAFCRDKTLADPEAWPAFMALVNGTD